MHKWLFAILSLMLLHAMPLMAQELEWSIDASVLLNNREGGQDSSTPDQTNLFTRLAPEVGLSMFDGQHVLKGGVVWYQPMSDNLQGYKVLPTLYYRYNRDDGWHVTIGMMPRTLMVERQPSYLWSDSLNYCQPNLRGIMAQFIKPAGFSEIAVDWRQMQTERKREAFSIMFNTDWRIHGPLRLVGHLQYNHLAMTRHHIEEQHVNDNVLVNPMLAVDLSRHTSLDSLRFAAGALIDMERDRSTDKWESPAGFVATATARWRWLQLDETFYTGQELMPLYSKFGSQLILGDPYFRSKTYSRTDLTFHIVSNRFVDLSGALSLHVNEDITGFWQQISCRFYIDSNLWKRRHDKDYLRSGHLAPLY